MDLVEKYKQYRKIGMKLNHKIMDKCLDRDTLKKSAQLLGIIKDGVFVFQSDDETNVLMDFALNDYRFINKNAIERYRKKFGWDNEIERDIFDALSASYTSLFKVTSISRAENILTLNDLLNKRENIEIIDIAFSNTLESRGVLVFTRLLSFKDFNMTSGVSFVFQPYIENHLIRQYKMKSKKVKSENEAIKRFVAFYHLYQSYGIPVSYL